MQDKGFIQAARRLGIEGDKSECKKTMLEGKACIGITCIVLIINSVECKDIRIASTMLLKLEITTHND